MTAVEWLINELGLDNYLMGSYEEELKKAREMERQQIVEAHESASLDAGFEYSASDLANNYYKEKYT